MTKSKNKTNIEETLILTVTDCGGQGDLIAKAPKVKDRIYVAAGRRIKLEIGDEFVGKVYKNAGEYWVKPLAKTKSAAPAATETAYGIVDKCGDRFYLKSAEKSQRTDYLLTRPNRAKAGDYVRVELSGNGRFKEAAVVKNFGPFDLNKATATLVLDKYDIPYRWNGKIEKELQQLPAFDKSKRVDLTDVPLVTIDGDDSKDFDDAVWAEETAVGFNLMIAIADVCFYVRPGSALDKEAFARGNSVYLPNMVVPMLPEKLSNDLCSLMPNRPRPAIVCFLSIDKQGRTTSYDFARAVIRSAARLTYKEVQKSIDGAKSPFLNKAVTPIYAAYLALKKERCRRGALNLETTELKIKVDKNGRVSSVAEEEHLESHRVIEEFMVAANNAAALALEKAKVPTMFRVHDKPREEKTEEMKPLLSELDMKLPDAPALKPEHFNKLIAACERKGYAAGISEMVLRMQCQAQYSPKNIGHFGLGLKDYVHFTSPIRRYADLLIHRALVRAFGWEEGGALPDDVSEAGFEAAGAHLCETERKAVNAERDLTARFLSSYLEPAVGQEFDVTVSGISTAGLFVRLDSVGAEGLIPMGSLPADDYELKAGSLKLEGRRSGLEFDFGEKLRARLLEASPITGGLIFKYIDAEDGEAYVEKGGRGAFAGRSKTPKTSGRSKAGRKKRCRKKRS